ncbi:peptidase M, neutral zinc metallopeptidase site [Anabaena cylindrica FACHB-243]|uniref:Peptidase M, neutral zinc metallopeptidase, zinc-binding site n=1 Tax=Anabaena cylindrica (strain ATCC 27899 / PCC 7122) TaxID=272123 RepID=K9ZLU1_ANACC|nr:MULTISPECIES: peptidase M [Anabaena]AFZ59527.1 peptidase M, neutral zinc metallopeptidase, zinc-binding site [Anabaena cylindrica PCC 7122]MBD2418807.1 peptidase M, neutral zinc metallopeptidase site [Anabaena cylindrica FACHB-243]MBY5283315.1 peptidase M, neutral zinc metallopeptidase site [Anabaena sp. CCAP 1446/1C]MBY5306790.1 peptidase M, neutral zinc metallopeptidase site [Anabaena sp. CCAP 1446/1C]MCM2406372.1 peptidase M, neutral zinc metallopeptidase site [Anabaena sp. CCAP 1446/1C]
MSIFDTIKEASQQAEQFALKKQLREAVTTAETALNMWAEAPSFWEVLLGKILIGNLVDRLQKQLVEWRNQVTEADKLAARANLILRNDTGDPFVTKGISDAIALYRLYSIIIEDEQILYSIQQCQQELQKRKQFQELVKQAQSQAENYFFKNAIAIYQEAEKLYITESIKQAFADALSQVSQEESYKSIFRKAKRAESKGKLQEAIVLLDSALTNFPRADGIALLQKLKSIVKGRELFRQGLAAEKAGFFPAAKSLYENAQSLLPNPQDSQIRLGIVAIKMQDWATALSYLQGLSGQQAAYLRGFALAQQANLQLAYWEWQNVSAVSINEQKTIIQDVFQYQFSLSLHNIEELVKSKQWEKAKTASREFIQKFGANALVENNLKEHIQPSLEAAVWQDSDWENIAPKMENIWIANPNITTLHNWTVATYYHAQSNPDKLIDLIIALYTAIANLSSDPSLQNIPWLGNKAVDFNFLSLKLKRRLEAAIDNIKNTNIENYLNLCDYLRWQIVALRFMGEPANSGMQINDVFITPGCYHKFSSQWQSTIVYKIHSSQKILHSLYTHWGLAVAACLEGDRQRAIQLKPTNDHTIEVEQFANNFVAYHEGCYHLQQQKWQAAITPWQQAKAEIKNNQDWQQEIDRLCNLHRQVILEFQEHLEFSQFWYDIIDTQSASSYLAEYQAEEVRQRLINKEISLKQALKKLQKLKNIDSNNPVVNDIIENVEFDQEIEEINRLFKTRKHEEMVKKARSSKRDKVRFIVAEFFIDLLIKGVEEGGLNDPEVMLQLGRWAYEICPDEPAFQEVYRRLKFC